LSANRKLAGLPIKETSNFSIGRESTGTRKTQVCQDRSLSELAI
jgi:hypothetical protein